MTHPFPYGQKELDHLCTADADFKQLIERCDKLGIHPERPVEEDPFYALMRAINDQLISLKAAATIWQRIVDFFEGDISAKAFAQATAQDIKACGTTQKKAEYMHSIACMIVDGELDLDALRDEDDQTVIDTLVSLRGIGLWTAQMQLIHTYERPDVISYGDAAIRRGLCMLKGIEEQETLTPELFDELTAPYHPFATTASIYLWWLSKQ